MRGQQQPGHLNLDRGVLVALHRRQGGVLIEAGHIVFEHTFTLERGSDIDTDSDVPMGLTHALTDNSPGRELLLPAVINFAGPLR